MMLDKEIINMSDDIGNLSTAKQIVLNQLLFDKEIDQKCYDKYTNKWQFILVKPAWYQKIISSFKDKNGYLIKFVELF